MGILTKRVHTQTRDDKKKKSILFCLDETTNNHKTNNLTERSPNGIYALQKKKRYRTPFESNHTCPDFSLGWFFYWMGRKVYFCLTLLEVVFFFFKKNKPCLRLLSNPQSTHAHTHSNKTHKH